MRVLLDVDGVLGDFPSCALRWVNGHSPEREVTLDQIHEHDILKALGLEALQERFDRWCIDTELCRDMPVYPGAQDFVEALRRFGDLVIVTSPYSAVPTWCHARLAWLEQHFGIAKRDVVFCKRKELVRGHVLIDDKLENCEAFVQGSSFRVGMIFDRPWNRQRKATAGGALQRKDGYAAVLKGLEAAQ
jgi:5'(3')-deoxyribonucleotidase